MHLFAFTFFSGLIALSALMIRGMFAESGAKIEAALAGEHRPMAAHDKVIYVARRRPAAAPRPRPALRTRLAA
ncbi:MAG: hypothetical protein ACKOXK_01480 [Chakrabartia sp.]